LQGIHLAGGRKLMEAITLAYTTNSFKLALDIARKTEKVIDYIEVDLLGNSRMDEMTFNMMM
jgi:hypothetical protein